MELTYPDTRKDLDFKLPEAGDTFPFLRLSHEANERATSLVTHQGGNLRAFVHPFFRLHNLTGRYPGGRLTLEMVIREITEGNVVPERSYGQFLQRADVLGKIPAPQKLGFKRFDGIEFTPPYRKYLERMVKILKKSEILLLVESSQDFRETIEAIRVLGCQAMILTLMTKDKSFDLDEEAEGKGGYLRVGSALKAVGVRELLVGGQFVDFHQPDSVFKGIYRLEDGESNLSTRSSYPRIFPTRCAGGFVQELVEALPGRLGFKVGISPGASFPYPHPVAKFKAENKH